MSPPKKTLLPELLPAPRPDSEATPKQRVTERARQLIERFRGVGALTGAAILGAQCGGSLGYEVVDPLPPPAQACTAVPDPFAGLGAVALFGSKPPNPALVQLQLSSRLSGLRVANVRVSGGTLVSIDDRFARTGYTPHLDIVLAPATETSVLLVEVDLGCGNASTTRRYRIAYHPPASPGDMLTIEMVPP